MFLAASFLSSGSIGLAIPMLGLSIFLLWTRRLRRFLGTKAVKVTQPGVDNGLGHRLATVTAHRLARTVDLHAIVCARRNRETAVETFLLLSGFDQKRYGAQLG